MTSPPAKNPQAVSDNVEQLIAKLHPDVVVTWGPEGGYGHPDHRLVSDGVTQAVQLKKSSVRLFYLGMTPSQTSAMNDRDSGPWHGLVLWHPTDPAYLPVKISFEKGDLAAVHRAIECHKSQFTPEEMQRVESALDTAWTEGVEFRPWRGEKKSKSLFK